MPTASSAMSAESAARRSAKTCFGYSLASHLTFGVPPSRDAARQVDSFSPAPSERRSVFRNGMLGLVPSTHSPVDHSIDAGRKLRAHLASTAHAIGEGSPAIAHPGSGLAAAGGGRDALALGIGGSAKPHSGIE